MQEGNIVANTYGYWENGRVDEVKKKESDTPTARSICEKIEREGGGMVDNGVIKTALKQGWSPIPNKILWSNGEPVVKESE